ncbi:hypothetical protein ACFW9N_45825 [Streptomyces sp. NPDC059496]|uniref:hypothetical protein n=1 Tax=Streptomyces sp. NPDC059496 TaxID=3346851 RepID=UPI00367B65DB
MTEPSTPTAESPKLSHDQIKKIMLGLGEANVINLNKSVHDVMSPVIEALGPDLDGTMGLHIICCSEYGLVTQ